MSSFRPFFFDLRRNIIVNPLKKEMSKIIKN